MAGPITLLTDSWKLESLQHSHDFSDGEQDTRTTFKAAEPKWEKKPNLYQCLGHLN